MLGLTVQGTDKIVKAKQKDNGRAIGEFDIAGKMVQFLGNSSVASNWLGTNVPRKVDPYSFAPPRMAQTT